MLSVWQKRFCCLGSILFLVLAGCSSEKNADSQTDAPAPETVAESNDDTAAQEPAVPVIALTATEFATEYANDREATDKEYAGKQLQLTGKVADFDRTMMSGCLMKLDVVQTKLRLEPIRLTMHMQDDSPWARVALGQEVTVQGQYPKHASYFPELKDCRIIAVQGEMQPDYISAAQLAADLSAHPDQTDEKYERQKIYLTGTFQKRDPESERIILGTEQKKTAILRTEYSNDFALLKPGQEIKVLGRYATDRAEEQIPMLTKALLIDPLPSTENLDPTKMAGIFPQFTPDRLVEAFRSNPRYFIYRYALQGKPDRVGMSLTDFLADNSGKIQIEGVIEKAVNEKGHWSIYLKNSANHEILCEFFWPSSAETNVFKPDYKVLIRGSLFSDTGVGPDDAILLSSCELIPQW